MSKRIRAEAGADVGHTLTVVTPVQVVCGSHAAIAALPHVARTVDSYLHDLWSTWTLESASEEGTARMLDHLLAQEWTGVSRFFREQRFENAFTNFFEQTYHHVRVLDWWTSVYYPTLDPAVIIPRMVQQAIEFNRLDVLQWIHDQGKLELYLSLEDPEWISCKFPQIVYWLHEHGAGIVKTLVLHDYCVQDEYFAFVKWAHEHRKEYEIDGLWHALSHAIGHGHLELLQWIYEHYPDIISTCNGVRDAIHNGHLQVAQWLYGRHASGFFDDPYEGSCDMETSLWLLNQYEWNDNTRRESWIQRSLEVSARQNQIQLVELLYSLKPIIKNEVAMQFAAERGHFEMIQRLHSHNANCSSQAMDHAAAHNHMAVVQWLHENRSEGCTPKAMDLAAANGYEGMVRWLIQNRSEGCTSFAMEEAAQRGYFGIIQVLHRNGSGVISQIVFENAVLNNHVKIVQWMHRNTSESVVTAYLLHQAGRYGLFDMVKWFMGNGYEEFIPSAMDGAAAAGHIRIVQYLYSLRREKCSTQAIHKAAEKGHFEIIKWYHEIRGQTCELLEHAAIHGHLKIVKFLMDHGDKKWDDQLLQDVAEERHFGVLEWLLRCSDEPE